MFQWKPLAAAIGSIAAAGAVGVGALAPTKALGQEEPIEEIVVTGSAIKRVDLNNALPIQVFDTEDIVHSGVTNTTDFIESIPAMQNYYTSSDSVGGSGGGIRTANLRGIGDQYTLSLLNGRRMAPADSGSLIDLSNVPLAAIERVEVLTDGASALYGSDAIAGVVNFIMKDEVQGTTFTIRGDQPSEDGGESWNADIVTGFGSLDTDGFSIVAAYSHQEQDQLAAADRDFAETGFIFFEENGTDYYFQNSSANVIPGNAYVYTADYETQITSFNPNALANGGVCAQQTTPDGEECRFDYTSTIEVIPEHERDSIWLNGKMQFTENLTGFATVLWSNYEMTARIAPYPTGEIPLPLDSDLVQDNVIPYLTAEELALLGTDGEVTGTWRALPAGNRTTTYDTDSLNLTAGVEGFAGEISYSGAITYAETEVDQSYPTGWLLLDEFVEASSSGAFNIFAAQEDFTDADREALAPTIYHGDWDVVKNTMTTLDFQASMPVFQMNGGEAQLAVGGDYRITNYERTLSDANTNATLLFLSPDTPYELERDQWGLYGELYMPVLDNLEITASLRYDDISAVDGKNVDGASVGDIDAGDDDTTYKLSALYRLNDAIAFRGSYGTGFKAPSMREIGEPLSDFGVTSGTFACPFNASNDPENKARWCNTGEDQYNVYRQGSAGLQFETSTQYTFGAVLTPWDSFDMTIDYWNIELEDLVERLTESQIFANPEAYYDLFTFKTNAATGRDELAIIQAAVNAGTSDNSGIDYAVNQTIDLDWGTLDLGLTGTYMIESESSLTGSSLGKFGADDAVVFRNVIALRGTLYTGNWQHNLNLWYRSGYDDQPQTVEVVQDGVPLGQGPTETVQLDVDEYVTVDYMVEYRMLDDALGLTFGVNNIFDEEPPLSLRVSGSGHQVGWDPRYTDPYGQTFYLKADYTL